MHLAGEPHLEEVAVAAALEAERAREAELVARMAKQVQLAAAEPELLKKRGAGFYVAIAGPYRFARRSGVFRLMKSQNRSRHPL